MGTAEKIKVLYIDDEQNNLNGFKATFRFDYTVFLASDTKQAYEHLKAHPDISIVLSDQRMPEKTGAQFFEEMQKTNPGPVRMLITGYADIEAVVDAVNKGHIFRYIKKPWTDADIKSAIEEGTKFYNTSTLLATRNVELQSAYDELGKFAYTITHDVRGPLLSVLGAVSLTKTIDSLPEIREILGMMEESLQKLDEFIKNTHKYYNLKKGKLVYSPIDFKGIVEDVAALFRIGGRKDHINFVCKVVQNEPFESDEISLRIILNNLLSNAFKYQRKDIDNKFVELEIEVKDNKVSVTVKDNGIGIHESHIDNIFTMFYRATSEQTGSGFGLYNLKDALNKLNGTIEVQSVVNEGTTFKVLIPGRSSDAS